MHTSDGEIPIQYDESTRTYRLSREWGRDRSISTDVVVAVGEITDTSPLDIEPLYEVVDPDALDDLHASMDAAALRRGGVSTSFRFHGCDVTVHSSGGIEIRPPDDGVGGENVDDANCR